MKKIQQLALIWFALTVLTSCHRENTVYVVNIKDVIVLYALVIVIAILILWTLWNFIKEKITQHRKKG